MTCYTQPIRKERLMHPINKKIITLFTLLLMSLLLTGCKRDTLYMLVPSGGPSYAQAYLQSGVGYDTTVVSGADALIAGFNDIGYDVIFAPINVGAKLYNAKPNYQLIGVVTWGNYYLISNKPIDLSTTTEIDVVAFGEKQIPDFMLQFILSNLGIESSITYLDSVGSISSAYLLDPSKVYLIAEPNLSILESKTSLHFLDLQVVYESITTKTGFPQAGVFVNKALKQSLVDKLKKDLKASIKSIKEDSDAHYVMTSVGITIPKEIYLNAIMRSHIDFVDSVESRDAINYFFELIYAFNPSFIGSIPEDSFYR